VRDRPRVNAAIFGLARHEVITIVATAQLLPRDIEDRVIYSVLAKPVARFEERL